MQNCLHCGAENKDEDVYCYRCGQLLPSIDPSAESTVGTKILKTQTQRLALPKKRWGTARLETEAIITFHIRGNDVPLTVYLADQELVLGRTHGDVTVDVDLTTYNAVEFGVSRRHVMMKRQNDTVLVTDLGSANNTYLNGHKIIPNEMRILRDGDELRLGRLVARVTFGDKL